MRMRVCGVCPIRAATTMTPTTSLMGPQTARPLSEASTRHGSEAPGLPDDGDSEISQPVQVLGPNSPTGSISLQYSAELTAHYITRWLERVSHQRDVLIPLGFRSWQADLKA